MLSWVEYEKCLLPRGPEPLLLACMMKVKTKNWTSNPMSKQSFKGGICANVINTNILFAGRYISLKIIGQNCLYKLKLPDS